MSKLISITEASELVGLSVTTLRRRVAAGSLPYTRANTATAAGKLLFDGELLRQWLRQENYSNIKGSAMADTDQERKPESTSYLGSLFKPPSDPVQAEAARDARFGYTPRNINQSASFIM